MIDQQDIMNANLTIDSHRAVTANAPAARSNPAWRTAWFALIALAALTVIGALVWQGITAHGSPDPTTDNISRSSAILDTGILVFREGLEAILVLAALTASLVRTEDGYWKPVALGAGLSFTATIATWFIVVGILGAISSDNSMSSQSLQAATGLIAIIVLLVVMNWFFHKVYWTGWITHHNRRKRELMNGSSRTRSAVFRGLVLIGFTSVYREGFEVVLFLQSLRLKAGSTVVLEGVAIGLALTMLVAFLTFVVQYRLPYKRMLVVTGIMLGFVLLVMVGEQVQEMQLAHWIPATKLRFEMPDWMNVWFGLFPTAQSIGAQLLAAVIVIGSYFLARRVCVAKRVDPANGETACILPDCDSCDVPHEQDRTARNEKVQISVARHHG
jgi:high-affinity iron transporter